MKPKDFYDKYWEAKKAVPDEDTTTSQRKRLLEKCLKTAISSLDRETPKRKVKVLDAGCGNGEFAGFIRDMGCEVAGMDISRNAVEKAKAHHPDILFKTCSVEDSLPFNDEEFDVIWSTEVLEHIFDVHSCLSDFNRLLKMGGELILTVPYHGIIKNTAISLFGFERHFNPYISHIRFFTKPSLASCLERGGFNATMWEGVGRMWPLYKSIFVRAQKNKLPEKQVDIIG
ncbi:MAG: class I SAM-dependent methyltransferase [Nitrospiraceae bacterium]|nr:MAG: class I SAM-dependent methyltransferase [Nitrospiraceae bacterium]